MDKTNKSRKMIKEALKQRKEIDFEEINDDLKKENNILKEMIKSSFSIDINLNDTFYYACADSEEIDSEDFLDLLELSKKHGSYNTINAYCSLKREKMFNEKNLIPINLKSKEEKEKFIKIKEEIELEMEGDDLFCDLAFNYEQLLKEQEEFGEKIYWTSAKQPSGLILQVAILQKQEIYGVGSNRYDVMNELRNKLKTKKEN